MDDDVLEVVEPRVPAPAPPVSGRRTAPETVCPDWAGAAVVL